MKKYLLCAILVFLCGVWVMIMMMQTHTIRDTAWRNALAYLPVRDREGHIDSMKGSSSMIIVYFLPGCDACEHEARYFVNNHDLLTSYRVYFISDASMEDLLQFSTKQGIDNIPNFKVLRDQQEELKNRFHIKRYPTILFFNEKRKLLQRLEGEISFSKILPLIK